MNYFITLFRETVVFLFSENVFDCRSAAFVNLSVSQTFSSKRKSVSLNTVIREFIMYSNKCYLGESPKFQARIYVVNL